MLNAPPQFICKISPFVKALILTDDAFFLPATCIIADCVARAAHNAKVTFLGQPRLDGNKPMQYDATASCKAVCLILQSFGEESMLSLNLAAMAGAPQPCLPLVSSLLGRSLNLTVACVE